MAPRAQFGTAAQTRILSEYARTPGCTDESLGSALADRDGSGEYIGSGKLVSAWRQGTRDTMTVDAFDVVLQHVDIESRAPIVDAFLRPHNLRAAPLDVSADHAAGALERRALRIGGAAGALLSAIAASLEDGVVDGGEAARLAGCLRGLVAQAHPLIDQLDAIARVFPMRVPS
jgi:hypothetical protein